MSPDADDDLPVMHRAVTDEFLRMTKRRPVVPASSILEDSAFRLLWLLDDGESRTLRQIADELELEQSTVSRQVNAAINLGYLERFEVPGSASRPVRPSPAGASAFQHDAALRVQLLSQVLTELGAERTQALHAELKAFNDAYDQLMHRS